MRNIFFKTKNIEDKTNSLDNLRLFTVGLNGYVIEWCLVQNKPKLTFQNPGESAFWDYDLINNRYLLLACEDGSPRNLRLKKTTIVLHKQYSKQNSKILSIKSNPFDNHESFFTGHNDGSIKKWNSINGQIELVINLTTSKIKTQPDINLIWSILPIRYVSYFN